MNVVPTPDTHQNVTASKGRRKYLGMVTAMDDLIGATVSELKRFGMYENSVIMFSRSGHELNSFLMTFHYQWIGVRKCVFNKRSIMVCVSCFDSMS